MLKLAAMTLIVLVVYVRRTQKYQRTECFVFIVRRRWMLTAWDRASCTDKRGGFAVS
jgi:hypothetical protein